MLVINPAWIVSSGHTFEFLVCGWFFEPTQYQERGTGHEWGVFLSDHWCGRTFVCAMTMDPYQVVTRRALVDSSSSRAWGERASVLCSVWREEESWCTCNTESNLFVQWLPCLPCSPQSAVYHASSAQEHDDLVTCFGVLFLRDLLPLLHSHLSSLPPLRQLTTRLAQRPHATPRW